MLLGLIRPVFTRTTLIRTSTTRFKRPFCAMSTETKSRQQPKWLTPQQQAQPVLKFQNSLTKTKV